ncbi:peptidase, partial [Streptomyces sp. MBT57]|nr:peptidase [Streptomyces sp. MBT57]
GAVGHAERVGAGSVTEEHLLLALLEQEGSRASFAVAALGLHGRRASLEASFAEARRRGGLTKADTDALAGIGIDVGAIVDRVEGAHGEGALAAGRSGRRWWSGHRPFTPG